jgi:hypothetical protein
LADPAEIAQRAAHLARTDHIALLKWCRQRYDGKVRDYTCTLMKQERVNGQLRPAAKDGMQEIAVKFLDEPFSVAMEWKKNAPIGDKIIYVEGKYDNQMIVRLKNPVLRFLTGGSVLRRPDGPDARKNTKRTVNLFGFRRGLRELLAVYEAAKEAGDLTERFGGFADVEGRRTVVLERYLPARDEYPAWKTVVYVDVEHLLPICIEGYDWEKRLDGRYVYKNLAFNVGLTPDDFLPEANGITMPKK